MSHVFMQLWKEEEGFIVSAEMILVATIGVLGMVVGLSEVAYGLSAELEDTGSVFASINHTFSFNGICGHSGYRAGSIFIDFVDHCDHAGDVVGSPPTGETGNGNHGNW